MLKSVQDSWREEEIKRQLDSVELCTQFAFQELAIHTIGKIYLSANGWGWGGLTPFYEKDCFLIIPNCAAVSGFLLQRAARPSTPGLHLDKCSIWMTFKGSRAIMCVVRPKRKGTQRETEVNKAGVSVELP
jgi:hypothetical protein